MLYEVMKYCNNFFLTDRRKDGYFSIENGRLDLPFVHEGEYILIEGSTMHDNIWKYPLEGAHGALYPSAGIYPSNETEQETVLVEMPKYYVHDDERFYGSVVVVKPPKPFCELVERIEAWQAKKDADKNADSIYSSESFGGYSYNKATGRNGMPITWQDVFANDLRMWRKI